jgi:hypothetical protein
MPIFFILVGLVFVIAGARNTQGDLFTLIEGDFTGPNNFVYWFLAILVIGALGYIKPIRPISNSLIALLIVVLLFKKDTGFFARLMSEIGSLQHKAAPIAPTYNAGVVLV